MSGTVEITLGVREPTSVNPSRERSPPLRRGDYGNGGLLFSKGESFEE
jgi:hypothetical protein